MRTKSFAVMAAVLVAFSFASSVIVHADTASSNQPRIAVETVCGQGAYVFNIRNAGTGTTSMLHCRLSAGVFGTSNMTALKSWDLPLFPMTQGEEFHVIVPSSVWGLKLKLEVYGSATWRDAYRLLARWGWACTARRPSARPTRMLAA